MRCWSFAQNIPETLPKEELAEHLTIKKRKISKDGDMIVTSKQKDKNFKELSGTLGKMLKPSNVFASFLKLSYTIALNFEDNYITLPINTLFIFSSKN